LPVWKKRLTEVAMDSIERRLAKLEAMARPQAAARFHVLLAGEPQPEDVGEG